jgi:hypothetical protein
VTVSAVSDVYFDPYDVELNADPYPMFRRLREEAPGDHAGHRRLNQETR